MAATGSSGSKAASAGGHSPAEIERAESRLSAARTRLVLDHPFLGALTLRLPLKAAGPWCRTTGTDARALYFNPGWINSLKPSQIAFALAHEALHCALGHFARRGRRIPRRWDLACDFALNPLLLDEGFEPPPGAQVLTLYRGMSAEEVYACLDEKADEQETFDDHAWDGDDGGQASTDSREPGKGGSKPETPPSDSGAGRAEGQQASDERADGQKQDHLGAAAADAPAAGSHTTPAAGSTPREPAAAPAPLTPAERQDLQQQWQRHLAGAAQRAREAGRLGGALARLAEDGLAPQVPWRSALAQHLAQTARDDYSWQRPSRREGPALLPSLRSHTGDVVVALDTSGSISQAELAQFVGEIDALKSLLHVRTTLLACDCTLAPDAPWTAEPWEPLTLPPGLHGGGGTDFRPVFDWVREQGLRPDALVYFTDAQGPFPDEAPDYPVLWLVKGRGPVPWGRRVALA